MISQHERLRCGPRWGTRVLAIAVWLWSASIAAGPSVPSDPLVDTSWLHTNLHADGLRIVDLRGPGAYSLGHINGAVNLPVDALFDIGDRNDLVAPVSAIQEAFRAAGIANADIVALYDDGSLVDAGRAFWVFELYGHEKVLLLDGGFKAWEKRRLPIDDIPVKGTRSNYIPSIQPHRLATPWRRRTPTVLLYR